MPPGTVPPFVTRFDAGSVPVGYLVFSTTNETRTVGQMQDAALNLVRPLVCHPARRLRSAAFWRQRAHHRGQRQARPHARLQHVAGRNRAGDVAGQHDQPVRQHEPGRQVSDRAGRTPWSRTSRISKALPLRTSGTAAVFLRDVATVEDGSDIVTSYALVNGRRTVYIPVTKRADASTLSVVNLVKKNLPKFQAWCPTT